jgi:hypothetical protein
MAVTPLFHFCNTHVIRTRVRSSPSSSTRDTPSCKPTACPSLSHSTVGIASHSMSVITLECLIFAVEHCNRYSPTIGITIHRTIHINARMIIQVQEDSVWAGGVLRGYVRSGTWYASPLLSNTRTLTLVVHITVVSVTLED